MPTSRSGKFPAGLGRGPPCSQVSASRTRGVSPGSPLGKARRTRPRGTAPGGRGGPGRGVRGFRLEGRTQGMPGCPPPAWAGGPRQRTPPPPGLRAATPLGPARPCASQGQSRRSAAGGRGRLLGPPTRKVGCLPPGALRVKRPTGPPRRGCRRGHAPGILPPPPEPFLGKGPNRTGLPRPGARRPRMPARGGLSRPGTRGGEEGPGPRAPRAHEA
eukprot:XP_013973989.1 proline-rich protein HaeIII subfamily 1-like [Canis lupus familiaris]